MKTTLFLEKMPQIPQNGYKMSKITFLGNDALFSNLYQHKLEAYTSISSIIGLRPTSWMTSCASAILQSSISIRLSLYHIIFDAII